MRKNYFAKKFVAYTMAFAVAFSTVTVSPLFVKEAKAATIYVDDIASKAGVIDDGTILLSDIDSSDNTAVPKVDLNTLKNGLQVGSKVVSKFTLENQDKFVKDTTALQYKLYTADNSALFKTASTAVEEAATGDGGQAILIDGKNNKGKTLKGTTTAGTWYKLSERKGSYDVTKGSTIVKVTYSYFIANKLGAGKKIGEGTTFDYDFNGATELTSGDMGLYIYVTNSDNTLANDVIAKFYNIAEKSDLEVKERKENTLVKLGSTAKLSVVATLSNKKDLTYTWTKEGVDLKNDSDTLTIENVTKDKLGTYKCTVTDGVKTVAAYPRLSAITASDLSAGVKTAAHVINTQVNVLDSHNNLPSGKATLTTSIPEGDYKYIWAFADDSKVTLSSKDTINYNASNRSVTFEYASSETTKLNNVNRAVKCYAIPTSVYETVFKNELEDVKNYGVDDVSKFKYNDELRKQEVAKHDFNNPATADTADDTFVFAPANGNVVYTETFSFGQTEAFTTSEVKNVKLGESVKLEGPAKLGTQIAGKVYEYLWTLPNGTTKVTTGKELIIDTVDVNDLGTITCTVKECNKTHSDAATVACKDTTDLPHAYAGNTLATKTYNMVYVSDLTATGADVMAKATQKEISLAVTVDGSLPITYEWGTRTFVGTSWGTFARLGGTYDEKEYKYSNAATFAAFYTGNKAGSILHVCKVSDGIKTIEVPVKVTEVSTYKIYENKAAIDAGIALTDTQTINVSGLKGDKITLDPIVVAASEAIEKELKYQWKKDGVALSTDKAITVDVTDAATVYSLTVTEGTNDTTVNYSVSKTTEDVLKTVVLGDVVAPIDFEENVVYTGKEINPVNRILVRKSTDTTNDGGGVTYELNYTLKEGVDYTVELIDAVNAGVSMFKINFIGNFADLYKNVPANNQIKGTFTITRAENKVEIGDATVVLGGSVQPKTVTNLGKGALTYTYYSDAAGTNEIEVPKAVGVYYVKATAAATINYTDAVSNIAKVTVLPAVAKNVKLAARGTNSLKVSWNKVSGATGYRVYKKVNGSWTRVAETTKNYYTFSSLKAGTTYTFAVKPYVKASSTVWAKTYTAVSAFTKPAKVAGFKATTKTRTTVKTTWKKTTGATSYNVYKVVGKKWVKVATVKGTSYTFKGLKKNTTYKFAVKAYKSGVAAASYPTVSARTAK